MSEVTPDTINQIAAVPIKAIGWSVTSYGVWALVAAMAPILIALFKMWPAMKKLKNEADGSLRVDLLAELEKVRQELREERADCNRRMSAMQNKMDAVTRQFVQFQLTVIRYMPEEYAPAAQQSANRLLNVISQGVDEFAPGEYGSPPHGSDHEGEPSA